MTKTPTLAQLLKAALENRLLDVHTAVIAKVENYDAAKQQVNVSPVLKRCVKNLDGEITDEQLPILCDVPVLFPRAGGFFISFPIQPGDFVQLIFNEVAIDDWLNGEAQGMVSVERFNLQGAVAVPGVYPESRPLSGAHSENFVAGKDNGVQLHIDSGKIRLGSAQAKEALAIASKVETELQKIISAFNAHVHISNGTPTISQIPPIVSVGTTKVCAE
jgi:hypothetical protein